MQKKEFREAHYLEALLAKKQPAIVHTKEGFLAEKLATQEKSKN